MYIFLTVSAILLIVTALVHHRKRQEIYRVPVKIYSGIYVNEIGFKHFQYQIRGPFYYVYSDGLKSGLKEMKQKLAWTIWQKIQDGERFSLDSDNYDKIIKINMTKFRKELRGE